MPEEPQDREVAEDVPVDVKERLQEVEDLVLLIQIENAKLKEKLGVQEMLSSPAGGLEERLSKLEASSGGVTPDLEQKLQQMSKQPSQAMGEINTRLSKIESDIKGKMPAQATAELNARLSKIESDIKDIRMESGKMTPVEVAESIGKINAARIELDNSISKFRSLKDQIEKSLAERQDLLGKVDQLEVNIEKAGAYFTRMKTTEEKINVIAEKVGSVAEGVDAKMRAGAERIEMLKRDIESRAASAEEKFKSRIEKIDASMESLETKSSGLNEKIDSLQEIGRDLEGVASLRTDMEENMLRTVSVEKKVDDLIANFNSLKDVNAHIEEEAIIRQGLESRLQDISSEVAGVRAMRWEVEKAAKKGVESIEEKIKSANLEEQLAALKAMLEDGLERGNATVEEQLDAFDKKVANVQQMLEALKDPLLKAKDEMEKVAGSKLDEFSEDVEELKKDLHLEEVRAIRGEIAEHRRVIQNMKADLEMAAARFFTTNLEEFARIVDRKFPGFITRDEYQKHMSELSGRLKTIEAPDLSPLASRVEMAERKLNDVHDMMQSLARTMPIVVE